MSLVLKKTLLPKLKARPIRTASGVSFFLLSLWISNNNNNHISLFCERLRSLLLCANSIDVHILR